MTWASPFANASRWAGVNQARLAVLAVRPSSLTHPAAAGSFQASASQQTIPHLDNAYPRHFREGESDGRRSRVAHPDYSPGLTLPAL
ncbi:hypothetical protein [Litorimonas sp.]|uniref:hypothetical protein n=1 Tax=Litorimonas sp. TaxID=1892381 RepID=UPI003A89C1ED